MAPAANEPTPSRDVITDFEFNAALNYCVLSYETRKTGETYDAFKTSVTNKHATMVSNLGVKTDQPPYIEFDDDKIRCIVANIGTVVYICVTGSCTAYDHVTNCAVAGTRIVQGQEGDAPAGFNIEARELGIGRLAREILRDDDVEKVILCGHSRGGAVAHVAHYSLLLNPNYDNFPKHKVTSVAFGSTPFLKSQKPLVAGDRFLTYYTDTDIVPALFSSATAIADRVQEMNATLVQLLQWSTGIDVQNVRATAAEHANLVLSEYLYFGNWIHLRANEKDTTAEEHTDAVAHFQGDGFKAGLGAMTSIESMKEAHGIETAYKRFLKPRTVAPTIDAAKTQHVAQVMFRAALACLVSPEMSQDALPLRLNRAIMAAIVLQSFGDPSILKILEAFGDATEAYLLVRRFLERKDKSTTDEMVEKAVKVDMQPWRDLMDRIRAIEPADASATNVDALHTFNETNIGSDLSGLILRTINLLAECFVTGEADGLTKGMLLFGALAIGAAVVSGAGLVTGVAAIAQAGWSLGSVSAMMSLTGASLFEVAMYGGVGALFVSKADAIGQHCGDLADLVNHAKAENFRAASSAYSVHLKKLASDVELKQESRATSTRLLEKQLAAHQLPDDLPLKHRLLLRAFAAVLQTLIDLEESCKGLVFIVLNGNQGVGKSWFIRELNDAKQDARKSTTDPIFLRYAPMADDPTRKVYLVDMPGNNSLSERQVRYTSELHGVGSIGISLVLFDEKPPLLPATDIRNTFNGCDSVLVCLNKVVSSGIDLPTEVEAGAPLVIPAIVNAWRTQFEQDGISFSGTHTKYHLMATEMHGASKAESATMTERQRSRLKEEIEENIDAVRVNGGQTKDDVVEWIRQRVDDIIAARSA
ncbi:hypothetical protein SDRG_15731 [Saprolegnia diclina VS20]|uniref:Fungal lipase-type domain-containing protein n=1 Tax=Saprolegnia diclina (strain VS20) TaxID=1156394 RepID=T0PZF3_SAPDV|nr:hypothetical protein SDRG_15731 [Saprolegnia diclina VS20]EQC26450.1 hypothetical protein SDRG_15731 [Saprolegnia diclina VS20]|eukprot:XP_008620135.1 hypothetical protein SDRG_15731 [Saprolegnia diclina VS20]